MIKFNNLHKFVQIHDITLRDGIQNLTQFISTERKVELLHKIEQCGCKNIEVTSFVSPKWVPQLSDAAEVLSAAKLQGVSYAVLVPNVKGMDRATQAGAREIVAFMSISDTHNLRNVNKTAEQSLQEFLPMVESAKQAGQYIRLNLGTAFGCEFEGVIPIERTVSICLRAKTAGFDGVTLCDTTGMSNPKYTYEVCSRVLNAVGEMRVFVHMHQRGGIEMANNLAALQAGITEFEVACGGLGGCPFAPGATGNTSTGLLVEMFEAMGISTGIEQESLKECTKLALDLNEHSFSGTPIQ